MSFCLLVSSKSKRALHVFPIRRKHLYRAPPHCHGHQQKLDPGSRWLSLMAAASSDGRRSTFLGSPISIEDDIQIEEQGEDNCYIEGLISALPLVRYLRSLAPLSRAGLASPTYQEFRLHSNVKPGTFATHLVSGSLFGQDKLPVYPHLFIRLQPSCQVIAACYIGTHLCGHPGYVHGAVPFALFDDIFARCAAMVSKSGVSMTANMNIDFRKPSIPDRVYVIRAEVTKSEGRKVWLTGSMRFLGSFTAAAMKSQEAATNAELSAEEEEAEVVAEARAIFIEPRFASVCLHFQPPPPPPRHADVSSGRVCPPNVGQIN